MVLLLRAQMRLNCLIGKFKVHFCCVLLNCKTYKLRLPFSQKKKFPSLSPKISLEFGLGLDEPAQPPSDPLEGLPPEIVQLGRGLVASASVASVVAAAVADGLRSGPGSGRKVTNGALRNGRSGARWSWDATD